MAKSKRRRSVGYVRYRPSQLASARNTHDERSEAARAQARRFLAAAERKGQECSGLLQNTTHARMYAAIAVQEAWHARGKRKGPTHAQSQASALEDEAIHAWRRAVHNCTRASARGKYPRR